MNPKKRKNNFEESSTDLRRSEMLEKNRIHSNICIAGDIQIQLYETTKCISEYSLEEFLTSKIFLSFLVVLF